MGFQQGLSGLNAASKSLEVIGNNVANSNTVGFKQSQAQFADVFASSLNGAGAGQVGIGTKIAAVAQQFTQGNITSSNNPLDIAINGAGFFRMSNNGTITYSRNGQFHLDKDGFIVNASGLRLTGYTADASGVISPGSPVDVKINTADKPPSATTKAGLLLNLDSRTVVRSPPVAFDAADPTTYDHSTSTGVYDSLGNPHVMQTFYVKTGANTWDVYAANDGTEINKLAAEAATALTGATPAAIAAAGAAAPVAPVGSLVFTPSGALDPATLAAMPFNVQLPIYPATGGATPLRVAVDFTGTSQFGSNFSVNTMTQDGFASGRLSGFSAGADGKIVGRYTNGQSTTLGQIVLANFTNPNGLASQGDNQWADTADSGAALLGTAGSGGLGVMQSSATEDSNVDLTAELVNMITAQRVYQANAQTIKTQDQVLQTLVNLR
jgi:flagellar hook protein FlgE